MTLPYEAPCVDCGRPVDTRARGDGFLSSRGAVHDACHRRAGQCPTVPPPRKLKVAERAIPNLVLLG